MLESGEHTSLTELAAAEKIDRSYLCRVLRLTLLAPEIVEAILEGRQVPEVTLPGCKVRADFGATSSTIRMMFGYPKAGLVTPAAIAG